MFDLSLAEVALIVVVAVVFIGPKELPTVIRAVGKGLRSLRGVYNELRTAFDELTRESGLKEAGDDIRSHVRMIEGDDGKMYEAYDVDNIPAKPSTRQTHE